MLTILLDNPVLTIPHTPSTPLHPHRWQMVSFFQVLFSLGAVYRADLPKEFYDALDWLKFLTFDIFDVCGLTPFCHCGTERQRWYRLSPVVVPIAVRRRPL